MGQSLRGWLVHPRVDLGDIPRVKNSLLGSLSCGAVAKRSPVPLAIASPPGPPGSSRLGPEQGLAVQAVHPCGWGWQGALAPTPARSRLPKVQFLSLITEVMSEVCQELS